MIRADFAVRRIGLLATLAGPAPRTGAALRDLGALEDAAVAAADGRIVWLGPDRELETWVHLASEASVLDAEGTAVVPGLVDAHTHLAFTGDRDGEIRRRLAGATYQEIAAAGGGPSCARSRRSAGRARAIPSRSSPPSSAPTRCRASTAPTAPATSTCW